jgi:hypothetical protein
MMQNSGVIYSPKGVKGVKWCNQNPFSLCSINKKSPRMWRPFACYRGKAREIKGRRDSWLSGEVCFYKDGGGISYFPGIGG